MTPVRLDRPEDVVTALADWRATHPPTGDPHAPVPMLAVDHYCSICGGRRSHWQGCPGGDAA